MNLGKMRILVTGGAGFIGSHLVDKLLEAKNTVVVYDNFDGFYDGKEQNIQHNLDNEYFRLVKGDILDYEDLVSNMKNVQVVFHMAAQCGVRYSIQNPEKTHTVNVTGTLNVLMAARQSRVKRLVYASSSGIFGTPHYVPMDEKHPANPNSPYGATKLAAEKYCSAFHEVYGLDVVSLRYFSVYGPRGRPDQVIHAFTTAITADESPVIYGDGEQTRDFTFVSDVVEATILAAERDGLAGQIFNIGYGREFTVNKVFAGVVEKLGKKDEIQPAYERTYRGEFPRTLADNAKARSLLSWKPKIELDHGLDLFIEWFMNAKRTS